MRLIKAILTISLFLNGYPIFAQYDYLKIDLEIGRWKTKYTHVALNMYWKEGKYFIRAATKSGFKETDTRDTTYLVQIDKSQFDNICQLALSISSVDILKGMGVANPSIYHDAMGCNLTLNIAQESITYKILFPASNTEKRGLATYLQVCKEMLLAARLPAKKILR
jgi:hypothetical protein